MLTHGELLFYMVMLVYLPSHVPNFDGARCRMQCEHLLRFVSHLGGRVTVLSEVGSEHEFSVRAQPETRAALLAAPILGYKRTHEGRRAATNASLARVVGTRNTPSLHPLPCATDCFQ